MFAPNALGIVNRAAAAVIIIAIVIVGSESHLYKKQVYAGT